MKAALLYIKSILLIACVLAEGALPMVLPDSYLSHTILMESEKEAETSDKKEDLKGEKVFPKHLLSLTDADFQHRRWLFDHKNLVSTQACIPILTPPPEGVA